MKLVIDIPEEMYDWFDNGFPDEDDAERLWQVVKDGTPLAKVKEYGLIEEIKAEIAEEKDCAYADFEKYKVDYLGVDAEYVEDELPDDDFRYGMERALEIICKHISGKENE